MQFPRRPDGSMIVPPQLRNGFTVKWYAVHALRRAGMLERSQRRMYLTGRTQVAQSPA